VVQELEAGKQMLEAFFENKKIEVDWKFEVPRKALLGQW